MVFYRTQYRHTVRTEILFGDRVESDNSPAGGDVEGFGEEGLDEGDVAFVGGWLDLGWESGDSEDVGGIEGAAVEEAGGVVEGDHYRGDWAGIALGEVV